MNARKKAAARHGGQVGEEELESNGEPRDWREGANAKASVRHHLPQGPASLTEDVSPQWRRTWQNRGEWRVMGIGVE